MYTVPPQSFPTSHSLLNDIKIKEDLTTKFGTSAANETGVSSSTVSLDWKLPLGSSQKVETDETDSDNGVYYISCSLKYYDRKT